MKYAVDFIDAKLGFTDNKGIAERYPNADGVLYPCVYSGSGNFEPIDFDSHLSVNYHRVIETTTDELESVTRCDWETVLTYQMKMVAFLPRKQFGADNPDTIEQFIWNTINDIPEENADTIAAEMSADLVTIVVTSVERDAYEVLRDEISDDELTLPSDNILFSVNYTIVYQGEKSCFKEYTC